MSQVCRMNGCGKAVYRRSTLCERHIQTGRARFSLFISPRMPATRRSGKRLRKRRDRRTDNKVFIYAMRGGDFIKFGKAINVQQRLKELQTGCPWKLEILGFCEAGATLEGIIHSHLRQDREQGEWFRRTASVDAVVHLLKSDDIDALCSLSKMRRA